MLTIEELESRTGLKITFIRKCMKVLKQFIHPYIKRGDYNSVLFTSNAVIIFDKIKQYKEEGLSLPEIRTRLEKDMEGIKVTKDTQTEESNLDQTPLKVYESAQTQNPNLLDKTLLDKFLDLQQQLAHEKEKAYQEREEKLKERIESNKKIAELEKKTQLLESALKLLPEGKEPETIKKEWEEQQKGKWDVSKILGELKSINFYNPFKRKKLIEKLETIVNK